MRCRRPRQQARRIEIGPGRQRHHAAGIHHRAQHQIAARIQIDGGVARRQHQSAGGRGHRRRQGIRRAGIERIARQRSGAIGQRDAAERGRAELHVAAQVRQYADQRMAVHGAALLVYVVVAARLQVGVVAAAHAKIDVAAARQHQPAVRRHAAAAAHRHGQPLAATRAFGRVRLRLQRAGIAADRDGDVAAAQRAETGEAHQMGHIGIHRRRAIVEGGRT